MNSSTSLFKRTEVIGRGKFGVVYKGYNKQTKQVVAIKVLNLDTQDEEVADVQQEIQFLTELKNVPNVTHYYGSFLNDTKLWIIMDYCAGGSIRTLLKSGIFEERYIGVIVRELLVALQSVHKLGVIHRDLKAANVLISKEGNVQLCDFGVAAKITSSAFKRTTMAGTPYWMAPEVIREGDGYNVKADIWSLGITVYEITTGNPPYSDKDAMWAMQMISKSTPPRLEGREYSVALKEVIALCLDENPDERPSAEELARCKLVKQYKNLPTNILKELVTKYLLWRDQTPSHRGSIAIMNLDEEAKKNALERNNNPHHPNITGRSSSNDDLEEDETNIQIKWDFDSLSSKEYIIENDIDLENVDEGYNLSYLDDEPPSATTETFGPGFGTATAEHTLNANYRPTINGATGNGVAGLRTNSHTMGASTIVPPPITSSQPSTFQNNGNHAAAAGNNDIPKSLQSLFEEEAGDEGSGLNNDLANNSSIQPPPGIDLSNNDRVDSPTIEIPDMDNLATYSATKSSSTTFSTVSNPNPNNINPSTNGTSSINNNNRPALNKPPVLYHTQSASGNLETRFSSNTGSGNTSSNGSNGTANYSGNGVTRTRKKTISNSANSVNSTTFSASPSTLSHPTSTTISTQDQQPHIRSTPPYASNGVSETPSPKPIPNTGLIAQLANSTTSPSKSMKALNYSTNPLLQPINFKAQSESVQSSVANGGSISENEEHAAASALPPPPQPPSMAAKPKRARPGLHIQMPTPSSTISSLSALTNNEFEHNSNHDSNVNQFGINPHQISSAPMAMTPVAEIDANLSFNSENSETFDSATATSSANAGNTRERSDTSGSQRAPFGSEQQQPPKKLGSISAPGGGSLQLPTRSTSISSSPVNFPAPKFPMISPINAEFFMDSTPKHKLVTELDTMLKSFSQALDALEYNL
ncbi:serine/threonine-protein kinase Kic1p [[Candida] railenensis]|uniref:non-specific serine/threonine protein kinase n=1 Tax=[Candida] railenensis TaxID=45579 RepID=A0A9P0QTM4_9ASCO|nr:serine/threonine-protein kinase Kic1p [[Candida] railenensis]